MVSVASLFSAPAYFIGVQRGFDDGEGSIDLFTLTRPVGEHPTNSTVSRQTLEKHGYHVPPRAELMKTLRTRPGRTLAA
jgi:hypothetical protein